MKDLILAFLGSVCPGILFNVKIKNLIWIGIGGALGWTVYSWFYNFTSQVVLSTFFGAVAVGAYSESMARIRKTPATVFSISGIFPLVPGIGAYMTVQHLVENKLYEGALKALETISSSGAIAFGIMLMNAMFRLGKKLKKRHMLYSRIKT